MDRENRMQDSEVMSETGQLLRDTRALKLLGEERGPLKIVSCELLTAGTSIRIDDRFQSPMIRIRCSVGPNEGRYWIEQAAFAALRDQPERQPRALPSLHDTAGCAIHKRALKGYLHDGSGGSLRVG